ncbi:dipeptide ABC transporter ATP-binding protein [Paenibacillus validus]|uniref:Dipeptide ABC transporter ATP-binding protein n=1 Tax=Paenibacillus validus TaxID=44253 RepID=A0A7X3CTC4_9BACL|nr:MULTISPECIES: dipeptide ABC transporter ATP-binding protein [Paenibacillus]MED4599959.1 dipeptide ABC transporter ATP-binding protein [Paenibacillus validus]MED4605869.1 dipeptide ABC transporter ATP-binding protein [Paenibacillus validus]MUG70947.1 dipeptide ABC transporter ATP-binding protein [Paenibacillus validus]
MPPMLEVRDLKKHYPARNGIFRKGAGTAKALDGVSLSIEKGETFAVVGESGCGKTTFGKTVLRLIEPTAGSIRFDGTDITSLGPEQLRQLKTDMQIVFQDPYGSLDPKWTIQRTLEEPLRTHLKLSAQDIKAKVGEMLEVVGLNSHHALRYPHELSGGQRQRIGIARALILQPKFVVLDEPVSALDVSIQAQILNLMQDLQSRLSLTYLFVSHDLSVVRFISDRVGVMYLGRMVEMGPTEELFERPLHPYTQALISAIPEPDPDKRRERIVLSGDVPSPRNPPSGCAFHTRCPLVKPECRNIQPEWRMVDGNRYIACHLYEKNNNSN